MSEIENQIYTMLGQIKIEDHLNIIDKFHEGQADRSHIITEQLMKEIRAYAITGK
ncbi:hypothetical protein KBC03_08390 [Patescibacteria group bacterium]|nr:hypothetical protein [Patescibacteria group bacterium]